MRNYGGKLMQTNPEFERKLQKLRERYIHNVAENLIIFKAFYAALASEQAIDDELKGEVIMRAHKLAGSAKTFSFDELHERAVSVEKALNESESPDLKDKVDELIEAIKRIKL